MITILVFNQDVKYLDQTAHKKYSGQNLESYACYYSVSGTYSINI